MKKLTLLIIVALVAFTHAASAQNKNKQEVKTVRMKMVKNINGVETVVDTTFTTTGDLPVMPEISLDDQNAVKTIVESGDGNHEKRVIIINDVEKKDGDSTVRCKVLIKRVGKGEPDELDEVFITKLLDEADDKSLTPECKHTIRQSIITAMKTSSPKGAEANTKPELLVSTDVSIYPNPASGSTKLSFSLSKKEPVTIKITDISGKVIYTDEVKDFNGKYENEINLKDAAKGVNIITIQQGNKILAKKLIVE